VRLLVSVRDPAEVETAIAGGADVVDAKNPARGALGAVGSAVLRSLARVVAGRRELSAAVGDYRDDPVRLVDEAAAAARAGATIVKIALGPDLSHGFDLARRLVRSLRSAGEDAAPGASLVIGAYADRSSVADLTQIIDIAQRVGARGFLLDTEHKSRPDSNPPRSLFDILLPAEVARCVRAAHDAGLFFAVAGSLGLAHLNQALETGADLVGVRGTVTDGGRNGTLSLERVRAFARALSDADTGDEAGEFPPTLKRSRDVHQVEARPLARHSRS